MANPKHKLEREDLMAFLLGELEDAEESRIENMFLDDPSLRIELETVKSELFEQYKSGRLNERRSGAFEKRYLPASIEKDREEYREMLAKNEAARNQEAVEGASSAEVAPAGSGGRERASSRPVAAELPAAAVPQPSVAPVEKRSSTVPILAASILVVALATLVYIFVGRSDGDAGRAEVTLRSFSVRGKSQLIALPAGKQVLLRLPHDTGKTFASYRAQLFFADQSSALTTSLVDGDVAVVVTPQDLQEGRYDIELLGVQESGESEVLGYYSFRK